MKIISKISIIFISLAVLSPSFSYTLQVFSFYLNREVITQKYCINKSKPALNCCGKCYLKKELDTNTTKDNPTQSSQNKTESMFNIFQACVYFEYKAIIDNISEINFIYIRSYYYLFIKNIIKPPGLIF
jgi:hypothetical protein